MTASSTAPAAPRPPSSLADARHHWLLDPAIAFLNHGSFGAAPKPVLEAQARLRNLIEARPIEMLGRRSRELLNASRKTVAEFVGAAPENLVFVTNATEGINAVLRARKIQPGEELLTTTHVYNAVRQAMRYAAARAGATQRELDLPLPIESPRQVVDAVAKAISPRTRLLVVDHISSPTATLFPLAQILEVCKARAIDVIVDGAHAPGMIDLDIEELAPAFYAANLHKWVCAPKGSAFLWVRPDKQGEIHPTTISHFLGEGMQAEFNWQGTRDITPWVCAADAIQFMAGLPGGWPEVMRHNHAMAVWVQRMLCERWGVKPSTPLDGSMLGSMVTVLLPRQEALKQAFVKFDALQAALYEGHQIEVPVVDWGGAWWVRPCCQLYNTPEQYERLAEAVLALAR